MQPNGPASDVRLKGLNLPGCRDVDQIMKRAADSWFGSGSEKGSTSEEAPPRKVHGPHPPLDQGRTWARAFQYFLGDKGNNQSSEDATEAAPATDGFATCLTPGQFPADRASTGLDIQLVRDDVDWETNVAREPSPPPTPVGGPTPEVDRERQATDSDDDPPEDAAVHEAICNYRWVIK